MFAENGCEDNPESRRQLIEAIREDWKVRLFVWVLGGDERKAFGVEDTPGFQSYLVRHHPARSLVPGCFYDHDDPRYWDYQAKPEHIAGARQSIPRRQVAETVLGLLVVAAGVWAARGLMAPGDWRLADVPVLFAWVGLLVGGGVLLLGLVALITGESSKHLRRLGLWVAVTAALAATGLHMYASWNLQADATQRERWIVPRRVDEKSVKEPGYIQQIKSAHRLWDHTRGIIWFVKVPATDKIYSCSWESGFAGFAKGDAVNLIDPNPETETGNYSGFIVGLHGSQEGRSASVWVLDTDELDVTEP